MEIVVTLVYGPMVGAPGETLWRELKKCQGFRASLGFLWETSTSLWLWKIGFAGAGTFGLCVHMAKHGEPYLLVQIGQILVLDGIN